MPVSHPTLRRGLALASLTGYLWTAGAPAATSAIPEPAERWLRGSGHPCPALQDEDPRDTPSQDTPSQDTPAQEPPAGTPALTPVDEATRARWAARLEAPPIYDVDVSVTWNMPLSVPDLGIPKGREARLEHAAALRAEGGSEALALLAEMMAHSEDEQDLTEERAARLGACLEAFDAEVEAHPDDPVRHVGFARVLRRASRLAGRPDLMSGAVAEIEAARRLTPDDPEVLREAALIHMSALQLAARTGGRAPAHAEALAQLAQELEDLEPTSPAGPWVAFVIAQFRAMAGPPEAVWDGILAAADRLAARADAVTDPEELLLLAESCRATGAILTRITAEGGPDETPWSATEDERALMARLRALLAEPGDADPALVAGARRVAWFLECAIGDPEQREARQAELLGPGLELETARSIALAVYTLRGVEDRARELAEALLGAEPGPEGRLALASYFGKTGQPERALGHLAASAVAEPRMLLARAVWLVQLERYPQAEALFEALYADEQVEHREVLLHALGVMMASQGDLESGARLLHAAQRVRPGGPWAATLEEIEALREG